MPIQSYDSGGVAFSPDGRYLVYSGNRFDPAPDAPNAAYNSQLFITRADGTGEPKPLGAENAGVVQFSPSWGR